MTKQKLGILVLAVMLVGALLPALLAPGLAEAGGGKMGWFVYTPNHPNGCAPLPFDCYVIYVTPTSP